MSYFCSPGHKNVIFLSHFHQYGHIKKKSPNIMLSQAASALFDKLQEPQTALCVMLQIRVKITSGSSHEIKAS